MKYIYLLVSFLLASAQLSAQQTQVAEALQKKTTQPIDSLVTTQIVNDLPTAVVAKPAKDIPFFNLRDIQRAREVDSLWLAQLYATGRFEEMYGTVTNETFEDVEYKALTTEILKNRLEELNARTPFKVEYNPVLEKVIKRYLKYRKNAMAKLIGLSDYYFPMFEETLDKHGIPLEMKYLAVVESALDPRAKSRVGATGLWQFMFSTGKIYGLNVNSYVDDRNDPVAATEAACLYLKSLYKTFGDWQLVLAAYNSGPGNVSKALRKSNGSTDFWKIRSHLPRETAGYLPAFLATMYIFEYAGAHGFKSTGPKIPYIATDTVQVRKKIRLQHVAWATNTNSNEIKFLNPSYQLGVIPAVKGKTYTLRLPVDAMGIFVANEEAIYAAAEKEFGKNQDPLPELFEQAEKKRYRVRSGDFLSKIANHYKVKVSQLKKWNSLRSNTIRVGQWLTVYKNAAPIASGKGTPGPITEDIPADAGAHNVKKRDSLWGISQKLPRVSIQNLKSWNDISGSGLKPGTTLKVSKEQH